MKASDQTELAQGHGTAMKPRGTLCTDIDWDSKAHHLLAAIEGRANNRLHTTDTTPRKCIRGYPGEPRGSKTLSRRELILRL